jgi:hypothetical protein
MAAAYDGGISPAPGLPGISSGLIADGAPHAGELFPQGRFEDAWFDDIHGTGWRFVTVDPDAGGLDATLVDWFATVGGAVVDATEAKDLVAWFEGNAVRWALQRPDFHLYGAAADMPAAESLLATLRNVL